MSSISTSVQYKDLFKKNLRQFLLNIVKTNNFPGLVSFDRESGRVIIENNQELYSSIYLLELTRLKKEIESTTLYKSSQSLRKGSDEFFSRVKGYLKNYDFDSVSGLALKSKMPQVASKIKSLKSSILIFKKKSIDPFFTEFEILDKGKTKNIFRSNRIIDKSNKENISLADAIKVLFGPDKTSEMPLYYNLVLSYLKTFGEFENKTGSISIFQNKNVTKYLLKQSSDIFFIMQKERVEKSSQSNDKKKHIKTELSYMFKLN